MKYITFNMLESFRSLLNNKISYKVFYQLCGQARTLKRRLVRPFKIAPTFSTRCGLYEAALALLFRTHLEGGSNC